MTVRSSVPYYKIERRVNPAAGAEFVLTGPGQGIWRVVSLRFTLVTSAVVANREVSVFLDDGTTESFRVSAGIVQAASLTVRYCAAAGVGTTGILAGTQQLALPTDGLILLPGWRAGVDIDNIDADDQISAIGAWVEEYPTGPIMEWIPTVATRVDERP